MRSLRNHMRNLRVKAASTSGETLVETLAAVLVSAFGLLMLAVAVSVAVSIVSGIDKTADEYYAATDALVAGTAAVRAEPLQRAQHRLAHLGRALMGRRGAVEVDHRGRSC